MNRRGENRAEPLVKLGIALDQFKSHIENKTYHTAPCVFISHKKDDAEACESIAQYIMNVGLDVYFDKYDKTLDELVREGNADKVTARIQEGIEASTHMICVISHRTISSYWVPFEVGYGCRADIRLGVLTLRGLTDESLPEYMKTTRVIRGTRTLNAFIAELIGTSVDQLAESKSLLRHFEKNHPLDAVLDWNS